MISTARNVCMVCHHLSDHETAVDFSRADILLNIFSSTCVFSLHLSWHCISLESCSLRVLCLASMTLRIAIQLSLDLFSVGRRAFDILFILLCNEMATGLSMVCHCWTPARNSLEFQTLFCSNTNRQRLC